MQTREIKIEKTMDAHPPTHCTTVRNSVSGRPNAFSGSSSRVSRLPPEQYSITRTFCLEGSCRQTEKRDQDVLKDRKGREAETTYLFHCIQPDNIAVVELPQHLKLSHLDLVGAVVAHSVKNLNSHQLTRFLQTNAQALLQCHVLKSTSRQWQ